MFKKGDFIEIDGILGVVVETAEDADISEDHIAVWFGDPMLTRISQGGSGKGIPEVWIIPEDLCELVEKRNYCH